ncbi:hypothetical protein [Rhodopseudomonas palustris]|nr:hypothetical protein [Rhodopseudomonas palustris]
MPWGLTLSALTVLVLLVTGWIWRESAAVFLTEANAGGAAMFLTIAE